MSKTIIVTGGAGFIGSHVTDRLLSAGHAVHVIDDLSTGRESNLSDGAVLHRLDIRSGEAAGLIGEIRPDCLVHLAAQIDVRRSLREPGHDASVNTIGGLNVVEAAVRSGVRQVVFASSAATYGSPTVFPTPEEFAGRPVSPYGISKLSFEHYLNLFRELHGIRVAILRFANVYGPRQTVRGEAGVVANFIRKMMRGESPTVNGDGGQTRDYVFVTDVAEMVGRAVERELDGTFNVSTGRETSVNDLVESLAEINGREAGVVHGPEVAKEDRRSCLDPARAREVAGWEAVVPVGEGLRLTFEAAKDDPDFV
ncbi:NAD-dependent epimerase/dehydratase family protein [Candidatus Uhrbacteria bacterium]|nr:NAD-dependent epimerase/dehydratase family protein [Candidatus Uhrbacteria bacterium]